MPPPWPFRRKPRSQPSLAAGTGQWRLTMPAGWAQQRTGNGADYFESADGTKGIYVSLWSREAPTPAESMAVFEQSARAMLAGMEGYTWAIRDEARHTAPYSWKLDAHDEAKRYRIVNVVVCVAPLLLNASFHDYDCHDYAQSRDYFAPIISSLELIGR